MTFQEEMQAVATELINEFGTAVKLTKNSGSKAGSSRSSMGVITKITDKDRANTFITDTDKVCLVKGTIEYAPSEGDTLEFKISKNTYTVIGVDSYNLDDVAANTIVYRVFIRP